MKLFRCTWWLLLLLALPLHARFLPVDQAFVMSHQQQDAELRIHFEMPPGHYLYFKSIELQSPDGVLVAGPKLEQAATWVDDAFFDARLPVFYHKLSLSFLLDNPGINEVTLVYQGCAEAGLCYPPQRRTLIVLPASPPADQWQDFVTLAENSKPEPQPISASQDDSASKTQAASQVAEPRVQPGSPNSAATGQGIAGFLQSLSTWQAIGLFFVLGLGLTFTPCVLPMMPIVSSLIVGQGKISQARAAALSLSYILPMALTYALAGLLVASLGAGLNLAAWMQQPWVLSLVAFIFVLLALVSFGVLQLSMPQAWQNRIQGWQSSQRPGSLLAAAVLGVLSALVVSPCISAPLAGALIYISATGDQWLGFTSLLALGLGMGVPLFVLAMGGARWLPKSGPWLHLTKVIFGLLLLVVALWLVSHLLPGPGYLLAWSILLLATGHYFWFSDAHAPQMHWLFRTFASLCLLYALVLFVGALAGSRSLSQPLAVLAGQSVEADASQRLFQSVKDPDQLQRVLAQNPDRAAMLFFSADWCVSCRVMERRIFTQPLVQEQLQDWLWIKVDVTDNNSQQQQMLTQYGLFGPPSLVFYDRDGELLPELTLQGEVSLAAFLEHLGLSR